MITFRIESSGHGSCGSDNDNRDTTSKEEEEAEELLCNQKEQDIQINPLSEFERLSKLVENLNQAIDAVTLEIFEPNVLKEFPELKSELMKIQKKTEDIFVTRIVVKN